jgi:hypothetical protein
MKSELGPALHELLAWNGIGVDGVLRAGEEVSWLAWVVLDGNFGLRYLRFVEIEDEHRKNLVN